MRIRTHILAGQESGTVQANSSEYIKSILDGVVNTLQGDNKSLRVWSLVRFKGDGFSNWLISSQKPPA